MRVSNLFPSRNRGRSGSGLLVISHHNRSTDRASQRRPTEMSSRSGRSFFVRLGGLVRGFLHSVVQPGLELFLSTTHVARQLRQLGSTEENEKDHEDDQKFLWLETCHVETLSHPEMNSQ